MFKLAIQKIIRLINIIFFKKELPNKISIYFHEISKSELDDLEKIILYFRNLDYNFVTIDQFHNEISNDKKHFAITFDDGFSSWTETIQLFEKFNVKATYFLNTIQFTSEDKEKFLNDIRCEDIELIINENELQKLIIKNHEIGAHTHSHKTLSKINLDSLKSEIENNLSILNKFNINVKNFAIPFGMRRLIKEEQINYLLDKFDSISFGEPGMLFCHTKDKIQRYPWRTEKSFKYNINNISTDTSIFNNLTKRSGLG